tara:strand:- start:123 stop:590 length:468 start_codon:yes stop_codon:yes gene_type:complete
VKKLLFLFSALVFISCSGDDDDNTVENQTFLERFDRVGFILETDPSTDTYYFFDDTKFLLWIEDDGDDTYPYCEYMKEGTNDNGTVVEILRNDYETLEFKHTGNGIGDEENVDNFNMEFTFISTSELLMLTITYEDGETGFVMLSMNKESYVNYC